MNLYTADLHFGHKNCLKFDHRPFSDVEEMDRMLIELWNGRVYDDDHVYIIGDFSYRSGKDPKWYLRQLKGHKHLITGNHDWRMLKDEEACAYFEDIKDIMQITDTVGGENVDVIMCHYPMLSWNKMIHGSYHIYGHIHVNTDDPAFYYMLNNCERAINAGCMLNNYTPASLSELLRNREEYVKKFVQSAT